MTFLRGFSIAMGANIIVFALSFLNNKLIYLYLSESDNGMFFLMLRLSMFMSLFLGDWLRMSSMNIAGKDKQLVPVLSANGFWYSMCIILLVAAPASMIISHFNPYLFGIPSRYLPVVIITGAVYIARNNWQSLLLVNHRMLMYSLTFVVWSGLFLLLDIVFLVILGWGIESVVAALIIASVVSAVWAFGSSVSANGHTFRPSGSVFGMSATIGVRAWIAVLGMFLMTNVHTFTLEPLAGSGAEGLVMVAMFSVGFRLYTLFQRASDVAGIVLHSHVVQQDDRESSKLTMLVTRNIIFLSVCFAVIAAMFGKTAIIIIASSQYLPAYVPFLLMLPGIVAINAGSVINGYFWGRTYPTKNITAPYVAALAGAALNIFLVPRMGVSGAALSFSVMNLVWLGYQTACFSRDTGIGVSRIIVPKYSDIDRLLRRLNGIRKQMSAPDRTGDIV